MLGSVVKNDNFMCKCVLVTDNSRAPSGYDT
jgi:hypothetical protein